MNDYAFLDCGDGRRLERFGPMTVARSAPAATLSPALGPDQWAGADIRFDRGSGWTGSAPDDWSVTLGGLRLGLRLAGGGQVGVFPEHAAVAEALAGRMRPGLRVLNLFAHTGQTSLRLASAGAAVVHVDAAPAAVRQARVNADLSGLADRPLRWLVDDALTFLRRDIRRGGAYDCIAADPPAYGRSKKGGEWKLDRDAPELLSLCGELLTDGGILCLTCHREGWRAADVAALARRALPGMAVVEARDLTLVSACGGNTLGAGCMVLIAPYTTSSPGGGGHSIRRSRPARLPS